MTDRITEDMAGCWLDGHMGYHNHYRVVDLAQEYGWTISDGDQSMVERYRRNPHDDDGAYDAMLDQGGLVDKATEYLDSLAPEGFAFNWDMGELSLMCLCQIEGTEENGEALKSDTNQCSRCDQRDNNH